MKMQVLMAASLLALSGTAMGQVRFTPIAGAGVGSASAEATPVFSGQQNNVRNIMARSFGLTASQAASLTLLSNGRTDTAGNSVDFRFLSGSDGFVARRVADFVGAANGNAVGLNMLVSSGIGNVSTTNVTDQIWQDGVVALSARAKFAGDNQFLATRTNASGAGTNDQRLSVVNTNGFDPVASLTGPEYRTVPGGEFRWLRSSSDAGATGLGSNGLTSRNIDNTNSIDSMVSYEIRSIIDGVEQSTFNGLRTYMIFFEDRTNGDRDFNDLAATVTVIPLPPAAWASIGTLGLVGLGLFKRRRALAAN